MGRLQDRRRARRQAVVPTTMGFKGALAKLLQRNQRQAPQQQKPPRGYGPQDFGPPLGQEEREKQFWEDALFVNQPMPNPQNPNAVGPRHGEFLRNPNMHPWQVFLPTARGQHGNAPAGQMGWNWNPQKERQLDAWAMNQLRRPGA